MKKTYCILFFLPLLLASCSYDEGLDVLPVEVQLVYPENTLEPYEGARVELRDATASTFVQQTNALGRVTFTVPPGVYDVTSANTVTTTEYRYICNGVKSQIVIAPEADNSIQLELKVTKKRIVH